MLRVLTVLSLSLSLGAAALAQVPDTLHATLAPPVGRQLGGKLGASVAISGAYTLTTVPGELNSQQGSGVVKVFDSVTGALQLVLREPAPTSAYSSFGLSLAVSGTRVAVGAYRYSNSDIDPGRVFIFDLAGATPTVPVLTLTKPGAQTDSLFGGALAFEGNRLVVGAPLEDTGAKDAGAAYVFDLGSATPTVPVVTIQNPTPAASDKFGTAVAISGNRVIIGAPLKDMKATDAGCAYVYDLGSGTPGSPIVTLMKPVPAAGDQFGGAVAISGTLAAAGAPYDDLTGTDTGSVYLFDLAGTTDESVATLNAAGQDDGAALGAALAFGGRRLLVGGANTGAAWLYDFTAGILQTPALVLNNPRPGKSFDFGSAVALSGNRVVLGAPSDEFVTGVADGWFLTILGAGKAFGYDLGSANPATPAVTFDAPGPAVSQLFGTTMALSGTLLAVSSPCYGSLPGFEHSSGSVNVYDLASPNPGTSLLTIPSPRPYSAEGFGGGLAMSGRRLLISPRYNFTPENTGFAYLYDLDRPNPTVPILTFGNPNYPTISSFGHVVAMSGRYVALATTESGSGHNVGGVMVYDMESPTPTTPLTTLRDPVDATNGSFGGRLVMSGTRLAVAAGPRVVVYDLAGVSPFVPVMTIPTPAADSYLPKPLALSGNLLVVGSPFGGPEAGGSAAVYDLAAVDPATPVATFLPPQPAGDLNFGCAVAISGTRVVVGNRYGGGRPGNGYVYDVAGATPSVPIAVIDNPGSTAGGAPIGNAVAIQGLTVVVSSPIDNTYAFGKGAVYVYGPASKDTDHDGLLDLWEYAHFGSLTAHTASDDSDHDGLNELMEQALNRDPAVPDATATANGNLTIEGGYLTLTVAKRAGVTYLGQSAGTPADADFSAATTTVLIDDATTLKVRDNVPVSAGGSRFLRAKVTAAP